MEFFEEFDSEPPFAAVFKCVEPGQAGPSRCVRIPASQYPGEGTRLVAGSCKHRINERISQFAALSHCRPNVSGQAGRGLNRGQPNFW